MERGEAGPRDPPPQPSQEKTLAVQHLRDAGESSSSEQPPQTIGLARTVTASSQKASRRLLGIISGPEFQEYLAKSREQRVKWTQAVDHVWQYLDNKEGASLLSDPAVQGDDQPSGTNDPPNGDGDGDGEPNDSGASVKKKDTGLSGKDNDAESLPGYSELAQFMGSDERWLMCRRFGTLQARLILEKQDEIRELEETLEAFDHFDAKRSVVGDPMGNNRPFTRRRLDEQERKQRQELMEMAERKFKEYADLVTAARSLTCYEKPARYEYKTVKDWILQTRPTRPSELAWIRKRSDIITLRGAREHASLGAVIEKMVNYVKQFESIQDAASASMKFKEWLDANAVTEKLADYMLMVFLILLVPLMFVVPIYALSRIGDDIGKSIGVLVAFALTFTVVLAAGTPAKAHEILSGSAAYLAVLVVFFGSVSPNRGAG